MLVHLSTGGVLVPRLDGGDDRPVVVVDRPMEPPAESRAGEVRLEHVEDGLGGDQEERVAGRLEDGRVKVGVVDELLARPERERLARDRRMQLPDRLLAPAPRREPRTPQGERCMRTSSS